MSNFLLYLKFEPYLVQWFIHEMGGTSPVELPRGSAESDILQLFLTKQPEDMSPDAAEKLSAAESGGLLAQVHTQPLRRSTLE